MTAAAVAVPLLVRAGRGAPPRPAAWPRRRPGPHALSALASPDATTGGGDAAGSPAAQRAPSASGAPGPPVSALPAVATRAPGVCEETARVQAEHPTLVPWRSAPLHAHHRAHRPAGEAAQLRRLPERAVRG
ncbi:hypothetical protein QJS66_16635 [Kocuria rhizophila]|nr:hypothetical protein QJS66_16635 [Kocuria rhizophila]